ncbi:MAG: ferrous iron transporter B, partial [Acidobacteria bacterium]|nr:ferrous iron transporter B [Acidobacteriota bacterium]
MPDCAGCGTGSAVAAAPAGARAGTVAIVGPPNSGKSTLFNRLTGLRQKVANFPGVTVEHRTGTVRSRAGAEIQVIDLPGVYSLEPRSEDEQITHDVLKSLRRELPPPDAVLLILDSTNLNRQLVLAAQVLALRLPTLVVLNMADELGQRGGAVDVGELSRRLDTPVVLASARSGEGMGAVLEFLESALTPPPRIELPVLASSGVACDIPKCREWAAQVGTHARYQAPLPPAWTRRLDAILLHPVAGPAIFALVVVAVFQTIFSLARPLMEGLQAIMLWSGAALGALLPDSPLRSLLIEGVWGGVGSVLVFLPQILLLFLFIGILEDSGYLARAAVIADRTMARFGLQGKSFIPLLSAHACAVPAILATRTIENKRDRIATILIAPF